MPYALLKVFILGFLIIYFFGGLYTRRFPKEELYPFFSWSLFDRMPNTHVTHTMRIYRFGEEKFDPPKFFADSAYMFSGTDNSPSRYDVIIQDLGESLEKQDEEGVIQNRQKLEAHMRDSMEYEIVKVIYNPLLFWRNREVREITSLGTFVQGEYE